jgi:DNA topoisomerase VI subunit B
MDFFSQKELVTQIGHDVGDWPLCILKELIDNSLDACEEADVAPVIDITADAGRIKVSDNGPGLPESTLQGAMDFTIRTSNREAYVAPDRGQQGNALKTLIPMPLVVDPQHGKLIIEAHNKRHVISCAYDPISQRPLIKGDVTTRRTQGTTVSIEWSPRRRDEGGAVWPFSLCVISRDPAGYLSRHFIEIVEGFAMFNPHATFRLDWFGSKRTWKATNPSWEKWKPCKPTSPYWYELPHLERLIGAYINHDRTAGKDRLVSDFVAEFDGLSGSQKRARVLEETGLRRVQLSELVSGDRLDSDRIGKLLEAMRRHTRPVKAQRLGLIGEEHLKLRLLAMGVKPESFRYSKKLDGPKCKKSQSAPDDKASFLPGVLESAFGWLGQESKDSRRFYTGANWSAAIGNPFRSFGDTGEGLETALADLRATRNEPVVFVLHLAQPRISYLDRGKSALAIGGTE